MIQIDETRCKGCGACVDVCPQGAITLREGTACIAVDWCIECGACVKTCAEGAILLVDVLGPAAPAGWPADRASVPVRTAVPAVAALAPLAPLAVPALWPIVGSALGWAGRNIVPRLATLALDMWDRRKTRTSGTMMRLRGGQRGDRGRQRRQRRRTKGAR